MAASPPEQAQRCLRLAYTSRSDIVSSSRDVHAERMQDYSDPRA